MTIPTTNELAGLWDIYIASNSSDDRYAYIEAKQRWDLSRDAVPMTLAADPSRSKRLDRLLACWRQHHPEKLPQPDIEVHLL